MNHRRLGHARLALPLCAAGAVLLIASLTGFSHFYPASAQWNAAFAPSMDAVPSDVFTLTHTPTPAASPHDLQLGNTLTTEEQQAVQAALGLLHRCAPPLDDYVRSHVTRVIRGDAFASKEVIGYIRQGESTIYLPKGTILGDTSYPASVRVLLAAANLVHEARHVEMGRDSTEPDAYRFELQVFVPACYPDDIDPAALNRLRQFIVADAYP
jgi:hypothetical protein